MVRIFGLFILFWFSQNAFSQDTSRLRVSLLTCTPGDELYSIFGHSAIRITDSINGSDIVYNYGTFDFDDAGFYMKFIRGKLLYYISTEYFEDFKYLYQATERGMTEQLLILSPGEKQILQQALNENLKEENKYYKYDFFFDNCTTRLRDLILKYKRPVPVLPAVMPETTTFRNAIHEYLDNGRQYWSKLGIDILLGVRTDRVMAASEQQFLPDNLMMALDKSNPVTVDKRTAVYPFEKKKENEPLFTPMFFFLFLFVLFALAGFSGNRIIRNILQGMDGILFFLTGLLGIILIFMWTATDHSMTKDNFNLLWAWPTHLIAAFFISRTGKFNVYFLITALLNILVLIGWFFLPQQMNPALIPFVLLLTWRSALKYFS